MKSTRKTGRGVTKAGREGFIPEGDPRLVRNKVAKEAAERARKAQVKRVAKLGRGNVVSGETLTQMRVPKELHEAIRSVAQKTRGKKKTFIFKANDVVAVAAAPAAIYVSAKYASHTAKLISEYRAYKKRFGDQVNAKQFVQDYVKGRPVQIVLPKGIAAKDAGRYVSSGPGGAAVSVGLLVGVTVALVNSAFKRKFSKRLAGKAIARSEALQDKAAKKKKK
jgi:hypothetical protein